MGVVEVEDIDRLNIFGATMLAMTLAVAALCEQLDDEPHEVLIDGNLTPAGRRPEWRWPARAIAAATRTPCPMYCWSWKSALGPEVLRKWIFG